MHQRVATAGTRWVLLYKEYYYIKIYSEDIVAIDDLEPIITALPDIVAIIESDAIEEKASAINMNIIKLAEHEQFKDFNGNIFEIEVRGERHPDKLFLKCMHVEEYFGIDQLTENILRASSPYIQNIDYVITTSFNSLQLRELKETNSFNRLQLNRLKETKKSSVYLTFIGFIRVILASNCN